MTQHIEVAAASADQRADAIIAMWFEVDQWLGQMGELGQSGAQIGDALAGVLDDSTPRFRVGVQLRFEGIVGDFRILWESCNSDILILHLLQFLKWISNHMHYIYSGSVPF